MRPVLSSGQMIVCWTSQIVHKGDVVVARQDQREIVKRVQNVQRNVVWLVGDNAPHSTDSRDFGWIDKSAILGVMVFAFPKSQPAPKLRDKRGPWFGWVAAGIMIVFALVHLFRIDTFVPEMTRIFGNRSLTMWIVSAIVCMEVFSLPFLMRMRLSVAAQYMSGLFAVTVPLAWLLIAIWTFGTTISTAQLGEFVNLPGSWLLIIVNFVWLLYSYYTIWALGYDHRPGEKQTFITRQLSKLSK